MGEHTGIAWCDHTFNVAWGCVKVSEGCKNCYASNAAQRFGFDVFGPAATTPRRTFGEAHWKEPLLWNKKAASAGVRRRVFCSSMCDVFEDHETIDAEREKLWPLIKRTPMLDWQLLTKRPERIAARLPDDWDEGYKNVWLGTSVESQADVGRITALQRVPARIRFLSCEPLLGPLDLSIYLEDEGYLDERFVRAIDWVIVGGESQPGCRPMATEWARQIVTDCVGYGVPVFVKQLGGHPDARAHEKALIDGVRHMELPA
jgi:protein gp37